jgi:L,D-transpeptidase YcbB
MAVANTTPQIITILKAESLFAITVPMKINKLLSIKITFSRLWLSCPYYILSLFFLVFTSCNNHNHKHIGEEKVMVSPVDIDASAAEVIEATLEDAIANNGHLAHFKLSNSNALQHIYQSNEFAPVWSKDGTYTQQANALYELIIHAKQHGLFPEDYHAERIATLRQQVFKDTAKRIDKMDAAVWAETDLLLSSAFVAIVTDLKRGRLLSDEAIKKDTLLNNQFYQQQLQEFQQQTNVENFVAALEPKHTFYLDLKAALKNHIQESASLTRNEGQNGNSLYFFRAAAVAGRFNHF